MRPETPVETLDSSDWQYYGRPEEGLASGQRSAEFIQNAAGEVYYFKPREIDPIITRAAGAGMRPGSYARRAAGASIIAQELVPGASEVRLARYRGRVGQLQRMATPSAPGHRIISLSSMYDREREAFLRLYQTRAFQSQRQDIAALDYVLNNLDRGENWGNYLAELDSNGELVRLIPIDHDLTLPARRERIRVPMGPRAREPWTEGIPGQITRGLYERLRRMSQNRAALRRRMAQYLQPEEIDGAFARLDEMLADIDRRRASGGDAAVFSD
jgi:hypothetical protein